MLSYNHTSQNFLINEENEKSKPLKIFTLIFTNPQMFPLANKSAIQVSVTCSRYLNLQVKTNKPTF